jgi:hypothetical protein
LKNLKQNEISEQIEEATHYDIQDLTEDETQDFDECPSSKMFD